MQDYEVFVNLLVNELFIVFGLNFDGNFQIGDWVLLCQNGMVDYVNCGSEGFVWEEIINFYV